MRAWSPFPCSSRHGLVHGCRRVHDHDRARVPARRLASRPATRPRAADQWRTSTHPAREGGATRPYSLGARQNEAYPTEVSSCLTYVHRLRVARGVRLLIHSFRFPTRQARMPRRRDSG